MTHQVYQNFAIQFYVQNTGMESRIGLDQKAVIVKSREPGEKAKAAGKKKMPALFIAMPALVLNVAPAILLPAIEKAINLLQEAAIREFAEETLEREPTASLASFSVPEALGTAIGLADYNAKSGGLGKMSKDRLKLWFNTSLEELLIERLAEVSPDMPESELKAAVGKSREFISELAAPVLKISVKFASQLLRIVNLAPAEDAIRALLACKLNLVINPPEEDAWSLAL